ncbi:MAG: excinuclease ABC subunit UvrC [Elusimicrobia bacterium]|nr:excinuclease ABC subunit UvrC [Elusimicrobiota bacterium]
MVNEIKPFEGGPVNDEAAARPDRRHLPHAPGVYVMRDAGGDVLYIGKAADLAKRVAHYFALTVADRKTSLLAPLVRTIDYVPCASEREALIWERRLIRKYQPFFNVIWKDDKSYPYVKITLNEDFPRVFLTRQKKRDGAAYFGPYPKVTPVRTLLRELWRRRFFPLRPCDYDFSLASPLSEKKIKSCLYYHTRECPAPCAAQVTREAYRRLAEEAALFFRGDYARLRGLWTEEMKAAAADLDYERAGRLRDNLAALLHIGERVRCTRVSQEQLAGRLAGSRGVTELQSALGLAHPPHHIEAFDISHFSGRHTVGSMVCFKGGDPNKAHYRRFKVRTVPGIDDFASMKEVVGRRYRRLAAEKQPLPDLIVIDGGKGQLGAAREALREAKVKAPTIGLAKRLEEVFLPERPLPLLLPADSPALHLLQRLRDEAHRFAVSYHLVLRHKALLND